MITNLLLLTGEDDYRLQERAKFYRTAFRKKYPDGEIEFFDEGRGMKDLENAVLTPNLFGGKRLAVCEGFWDTEKFEQAEKSQFFKKLPEFSDTCTLLVTESKLDKRLKVSKFLLAQARVEKFDPLDEIGVLTWIENYCVKNMGKISRHVAKKLLDRCGENLWNLSRELQKLITAGEGEVIESLIEELTLRHPKLEIWDFLGDLSRRNARGAIERFRNLLEGGSSIHQIFAMILREIRIHAMLRSSIEQNFDSRKIALETKLHPFVVQKTLPLTREFSCKQIERMYDQLFVIDRRLKTGGIVTTTDDTSEFELAIEKFIVEVCKKESKI